MLNDVDSVKKIKVASRYLLIVEWRIALTQVRIQKCYEY